jgi:glutamate synthase domain-containing protein 3
MGRKTESEKAKEILEKREHARQGFREGAPGTAEEKKKERMKKVRDEAWIVDLGLKRR